MLGKEKILIIDDSIANTVLINAVLKQEGYNISIAFNVKDGLSYMEENKPDLILLDLMMPDVSGYDFLRILKDKKQIVNIPIIIISAIKTEEEINAAIKLGASDYISKPIDILHFLEKVNWAIKKSKVTC